MQCNANDTNNITACYIPSIESRCSIDEICSVTESSYNSNCTVTGIADQYMSKLAVDAFECFNLTKICVPADTSYVEQGCDFLFGSRYKNGNLSDDWVSAGTYNTEPVSALYASDIKYGPWDFLAPFSTRLWILILVTIFILTPLVMSFVEYDEDETIWENFWKFMPDSIHAHMGVDLVNNDQPTKNTSYILSVFVSIFTFIILTLYASNLTTFVLYKNGLSSSLDSTTYGDRSIFIDDTIIHLINSPGAIPVSYYDIPALHASGKFGVIVSEDFFLRDIKSCEEEVAPLRAFGIYKNVIVSSKLGEQHIKQVKKTVRRAEFITRIYTDACQTNRVKPIKLGGIYGVFILFLGPAICITLVVVFRYFMTRKSTNPYITPSL